MVADGKDLNEIDLSAFVNGMYFVKIHLEGSNVTRVKKIIVKHP